MTKNRWLGTGAALAVVLLLGACAFSSGDASRDRPAGGRTILYSPNAEPLSGGPLGSPRCEEALSAWFDRVDADHDGTLSREEFLADAGAQFERMDLDHDGWITPAELDSFRIPYEPPAPRVVAPSGSGGTGGVTGEGGHRRRAAEAGTRVREEADPVMSADVHLLFRVSRTDFLAQARDIFARLDAGHAGRLSRADVLATCHVDAARPAGY